MLLVPAGGNSFQNVQSNAAGRPNAAQGTAVTPAVGSKGSWAQVFASLDFDTFGLLICINGNSASAASRNTVIDIGVGGSGSEIVLIPDLIAGNAIGYTTMGGGGLWYYFPVAIPAGTRLSIRAQGTVTTGTQAYIQAFQKPLNPAMVRSAAYVEAIGMTLPQGTAVTAGGASEGSWTLLGATTKACWHWQVGAQVTSADTTHAGNSIHIDIAEGDASNKNVILQDVILMTSTSEQACMGPKLIGCEWSVPAGRNIYARAQASGTADSLFISAYGAGG